MRLPFLRSKEDPASGRGRGPASTTGNPNQDAAKARTQARQRLVGAVVLLAVGVIGFPILFETQPRPLPVDTPIEIVRHSGGGNAPAAAGKVRSATLPPPDAGIELAASAPAAAASRTLGSESTAAVAARPEPAQPPAEVPARSQPASAASAAVPAAAAPSASAASAAQAARFVVQAGAYLDAASLREARQKVEKLGLKTYTQVVETPTGKRTRVRVGPFEKRTEADTVADRIKATGLSVVVLTL